MRLALTTSLLALGMCLGCDPDTSGDHPARDASAGQDGGSGGRDASPPAEKVVFPRDFEQRYVEMRDCRLSHEHELRYIRVLVDERAREPYAALSEDAPYPVGATLVKPEYDDEDCSVVLGYTALQKLEPGASPDTGDWLWQKLTPEHELLHDEVPERCIGCHEQHCAPPYGYDLTCAEEL